MARKEKTLQFRLIFGIFRHLWTKSSILLPFYYQWKSGLLPAESGQYYFESSRCGVKTDDNEAKVADVSAKVTHVCADSVDIWAKLADLWSNLVDNRASTNRPIFSQTGRQSEQKSQLIGDLHQHRALQIFISAILDLTLNSKPWLRSIVAMNLLGQVLPQLSDIECKPCKAVVKSPSSFSIFLEP